MIRKLASVAVALMLAACATTPQGQLTEARGLSASWAALDAVANTLDGLAKSHVLTGQKALTAATDLQKATDALTAATAAYNASDNATAQQNVAVATELIAALVSIAQTPN